MDSSATDQLQPDRRITKLARDVSSAADNYVPRLLLQLQGTVGLMDGHFTALSHAC